jgi:hypothetical protein
VLLAESTLSQVWLEKKISKNLKTTNKARLSLFSLKKSGYLHILSVNILTLQAGSPVPTHAALYSATTAAVHVQVCCLQPLKNIFTTALFLRVIETI